MRSREEDRFDEDGALCVLIPGGLAAVIEGLARSKGVSRDKMAEILLKEQAPIEVRILEKIFRAAEELPNFTNMDLRGR